MLVVDAGPLVAAAATRDRNHERCVALLSQAAPPLVVPALVVTEVAYFLGDRLGHAAEHAFARSLRDGELLVEPVELISFVMTEKMLRGIRDRAERCLP